AAAPPSPPPPYTTLFRSTRPEPQDVARQGRLDSGLDRIARRDLDLGRRRGRPVRQEEGNAREGRGPRAHGHGNARDAAPQAFGSTIMRPFISMCRAWQNHWQ